MTEQNERPYNGTYYTLEDKHFWAAFFNLARHNAYITLTHIDRAARLQQSRYNQR